MLPLERIHKPEDPALLKKYKCRSNTEQGAYNFAAPERVAQLSRVFQATWFHPGDDGVTCRFGLKDDYVLQAIQVLKAWMLPRAGANPDHDKNQELMSWRQTLHFHGFEMTNKEIEELAATAIAVLCVRCQWISTWLIAEKAKLPACSSGVDAAFELAGKEDVLQPDLSERCFFNLENGHDLILCPRDQKSDFV
eukprot:s2744_g3.t1